MKERGHTYFRINPLHRHLPLLVAVHAPIVQHARAPRVEPFRDAGAGVGVRVANAGDAFVVEEKGGGVLALGIRVERGGGQEGEFAEELVEVEFEGLHGVEEVRVKAFVVVVDVSWLVAVGVGGMVGLKTEAAGHEAFVLRHEDGFVLLSHGGDDGFGALDELGREVFAHALGDEFVVVDVRAGADQFAERLAEPDEVPPDDGRLVAVGVAQHVVVVVGRVVRVEVVEEGEGAEVDGEAKDGGVVRVEDAVGKGVGLPCRHGFGVPSDDLAVESGESVFFGSFGAL